MSVTIDGVEYTWNTPCCGACWVFMYPDGREPFVVGEVSDEETCGNCGMETTSGIFIRRDPRKIRYPKREDEE